MLHNPFGPKLPVDRFEATLATHRAMLEQLVPSQQGDALQHNIRVEGQQEGGAEGQGEGQREGGEAAVKQEPAGEASVEGMEVDAEGEAQPAAAAEEEEDEEEEPAAPTRSRECSAALRRWRCRLPAGLHPPASSHVCHPHVPALPPCAAAEVGYDGTLEELQALVASLDMAVAFSEALTACMPAITQLLASSTISDVQESIAMLLTCKQFEVDGAGDTIRRMLPLIFAKDQGGWAVWGRRGAGRRAEQGESRGDPVCAQPATPPH